MPPPVFLAVTRIQYRGVGADSRAIGEMDGRYQRLSMHRMTGMKRAKVLFETGVHSGLSFDALAPCCRASGGIGIHGGLKIRFPKRD